MLRRIGFHAIDEVDGARILEDESRRVHVPSSEVIDPDALLLVLREAGVGVTTFLDHLGILEAG